MKAKLENAGITRLTDLDTYARAHKVGNEIPSRYEVFCTLVGENAAISMLNELAIRQCC